MAWRPSARGHAPFVAYADYFQFASMCEHMHEAYRDLIAAVAYSRRQQWPENASRSSQRTALLRGLAEYPDMRVAGMSILLRLTKGRGYRYCSILNEDIIAAVTTSSRTYVNTLLRLNLLNTDITFRLNMEDLMTGMRDAVVQCCGHCDTHTGRVGADLFHSNFVPWGAPELTLQTYYPLSGLPEVVLAFAMTAHENLHRRESVVLPDDVLRKICALLVATPSVV